jgi:hypothetical protein
MIDTDEGRPPARSEDKYRRVWRKLIHHHAYSIRPLLTDSSPAIRTYHLLSVVISGSERLRSDIKFEESFLKLSFILYLLSFCLGLSLHLKFATSIAEGGNSKRMKPGIKIEPKMKLMQLWCLVLHRADLYFRTKRPLSTLWFLTNSFKCRRQTKFW